MNLKLILDFLGDLKKNNNREWFEKNKPRFREAEEEFKKVVEHLIHQLSEFDPAIGQLKPKDCIFRIYRDVRFSKNKDPYKTNFGAAISRGGRKSSFALYYLHLEDNNSFVAGGIYMPPNDVLAKVRQEIDYNADEFKKIINHSEFKKYFGSLEGDKLKKAPRGYDPENENIELIKHKSYLAVNNVKNDRVLANDFLEYCAQVYKAMTPLNDFINRPLTE